MHIIRNYFGISDSAQLPNIMIAPLCHPLADDLDGTEVAEENVDEQRGKRASLFRVQTRILEKKSVFGALMVSNRSKFTPDDVDSIEDITKG